MSKIIIEVPDKCSDCKHRKSNICLLFEKTIGGGYNSNLYVRCPNCIAAEVKEENKLPKYKEGESVEWEGAVYKIVGHRIVYSVISGNYGNMFSDVGENELKKEGHTVLDKTTGLFVDEEVKE